MFKHLRTETQVMPELWLGVPEETRSLSGTQIHLPSPVPHNRGRACSSGPVDPPEVAGCPPDDQLPPTSPFSFSSLSSTTSDLYFYELA